jgi:hypothetical protein
MRECCTYGFVWRAARRRAVLPPRSTNSFDPDADKRGELFEFVGEVALVTRDDPPVYMDYLRADAPLKAGESQPDPSHSAIQGIMLAEKLKELGIEAIVSYKGQEDTKYGSIETFLIGKLSAPAKMDER